MWASGDDVDTVDDTIVVNRSGESVTRLDALDDRYIYRGNVSDEVDIETAIQHGRPAGTVLIGGIREATSGIDHSTLWAVEVERRDS